MKEKKSKCPACGSQNPPSKERCETCGSLLDLTSEEKNILDNLTKISKVGRSRAEEIVKSGLSRVEDLEKADIDDFTSIKGIGTNLGEKIFDFLEDVKDEKGEMKTCEECGSLIGRDLDRCPECKDVIQREEGERGEKEEKEEVKKDRCPLCGSLFKEGVDSCPVCGGPIKGGSEKVSSVNSDEEPKEERLEKDMGEEVTHSEDIPGPSIDEKLDELSKEEIEEIVDEIKKLEGEVDSGERKEGDANRKAIEKEKKERYEAYPGELEEDKARIKDTLKKLNDDRYISTDKAEVKFDELLSYEEEKKYNRALDLAIELLFDVKSLEMLKERLDETKDMKKNISNKKSKKKLSNKLKKIRDRCETGEYEEALRLSRTLSDICQDDQKGRLEKNFDKKLRRVRKNLKVANEGHIDLKNIKANLKKALKCKESGNVKKAISYLVEALNQLQQVFVFSSKLEEAKRKLSEMRKNGRNTKNLSQRLKNLKDLAEEGNFDQANDQIEKLLGTIDERKTRWNPSSKSKRKKNR